MLLIAHWLVAHKIGLILSWLASSCLNSMSTYPGPDAPKVVQAFHWLLDAISCLSRWHAKGSIVKLPIVQRSSPAPVVGSPVTLAPPRGLAILIVLAIAGGVALVGAIIGLVASGHGAVITSCGEKAVAALAGTIEGDVGALLTGEQSDWQAQLDGIGAKVGESAVLCAISELLNPPDGGRASLAPVAQVNARAYLALHAK